MLEETPMLQPFWAAGFSFSRGHFVARVPYDCCLPMMFQGEEISMAARAWSHGYDFYAPMASVVFHEYEVCCTQHWLARRGDFGMACAC